MKLPNWKSIVAGTILILFWGPIFIAIMYWIFWKFLIQMFVIENWEGLLLAIAIVLLGMVVWWAHDYFLGDKE